MPKRQISFLEDQRRHDAFQEAIRQGVREIEARDMECRVLDLGAGAGLHSLMALEAGAVHVTAVERCRLVAEIRVEPLDVSR